MYRKEQLQHEKKLQQMKLAGAEPHQLKHQENVVAEATAVVPDTRERLETASLELEGLITAAKEGPELSAARDSLQQAATALEPEQ